MRIHSITTTRQEGIMKELKDMMLKQNEAILQQEMTEADSQGTEIEKHSTAALGR